MASDLSDPPRLRVLVVDDDAHSLAAMRRRLRPYRTSWDLEFLTDARAALERTRAGAVDVIVTDLTMPNLPGNDLLDDLRTNAPNVVRVLMSARPPDEPTVAAARVAHRFLPKPFLAGALEAAIARAQSLRALPVPAELSKVIGAIAKGPMFPLHAGELLDPLYQVMRDDDLEPSRLLTARLFEQLRVPTGLDPNPCWRRGSEAGRWAIHLCRCEGLPGEVRAHAVMASMLFPLGLLLTARYDPDALPPLSPADVDAHLDTRGADHASVGAYALALWGFPDAVVEAVAFHHAPASVEEAGLGATTITHVACALERVTRDGADESTKLDLSHLDLCTLERLGMADRVAHWLETRPPAAPV